MTHFKRTFFIIFFNMKILLIFLFLIDQSHAANNGKYYRLKDRWTRSFDYIVPFDANHDGIDELFIQHGKTQYDIIDYDLNNYYKSFTFSEYDKYRLNPLLSTNTKEVYFLATYSTEDSIVYKILQPTQQTIGKSISEKYLKPFFTFTRNKKTQKDIFHQSMAYISSVNSSSGKNIELFSFNTAWDKFGERGLLAANIENQKIKWKRSLGTSVYNYQIDDIDKDGEDEIILGTYANNNGVKGENTSDDSCHVFVFEADGKLKWKRTIGPYWTGAWIGIGDFWGDGNKNIAVYQFSNRKLTPNQDQIQILNSRDGTNLVKPKRFGNQFTRQNYFDLNNCYDFTQDGKDEIVVGNSDGFVRMLDGNLTEIYISQNYQKHIIVNLIEDMDGDGVAEIICSIPNDRIIVLDNQLKELCQWQLRYSLEPKILPVHAKRKTNLLVTLTTNNFKEHRLLEIQSSAIPLETITGAQKYIGWIISAILFIFAVMVIFYLYFKRNARNLLASLLNHDYISSRALIISTRGKIKKAGFNWLSIIDMTSKTVLEKPWEDVFDPIRFKNFKHAIRHILEKKSDNFTFRYDSQTNNNQHSLKIISLFLPYARTYCLLLFDLTDEEHNQQLKHWAQVAQRLAHSIKNPLTTVKLNAEELRHFLEERSFEDRDETLEFIDAIIGQVNKLKKMSDGFMRFVEFEKLNQELVDLQSVIENLILEWQPQISKKILIRDEFEESLPKVMIDQEQFAYALKNVFFNAVESIKNKGKILISARKVQMIPEQNSFTSEFNYIELQIRDTGCGIPPEFIEKVTQPYFSRNKPEGTGLGLSIVKKVIEAHGAKFDIQSELNHGTTVTFWFKI